MSEHWSKNVDLQQHILCEDLKPRVFTTKEEYNTVTFMAECLSKVTDDRNGIMLKGKGMGFYFFPSVIKRNRNEGTVSVVGGNGGDEHFCVVEVVLDPTRDSQKLTVKFYHDLRALPAIVSVD